MTRSFTRAIAISLAGAGAAAGLLAGPVQADAVRAAAPHGAVNGWRLFTMIAPRGKSVELESIDAVGPADAWAAGLIGGPAGQHQQALLAHWNGRTWRRVALPARAASLLGGSVGFVFAAAKSDRDAWVFSQTGRYLRLRGGEWIAGRVPLKRGQDVLFDQAFVFGPRDVWVFGVRFLGPVSRIDLRPYAARFDGQGWATVPVPGKGALAVSAISSRNMWAVTGANIPGSGIPASPRVVRWNGRGWHVAAVQPVLPRHATIDSVLAVTRSQVWLGGSRPNRRTGASELARRWKGRAWVQVNPPARPSEQDIYLQSIVADGAGGVWALTGSLGSADPGPARIWHDARGTWSGPQAVSPRWLLLGLAWVPRTRSVWGVADSPGLVQGLLVLHGPVPR